MVRKSGEFEKSKFEKSGVIDKAKPRDQGKSSNNWGIRIIACSKNRGSTVFQKGTALFKRST